MQKRIDYTPAVVLLLISAMLFHFSMNVIAVVALIVAVLFFYFLSDGPGVL